MSDIVSTVIRPVLRVDWLSRCSGRIKALEWDRMWLLRGGFPASHQSVLALDAEISKTRGELAACEEGTFQPPSGARFIP